MREGGIPPGLILRRGRLARTSRLFGLLASANLLAWLWAWSVFAQRPALLGTALLAWVFGLRHAVDADHIAAIDNVVRKLMQQGRRPATAGLWFSLGHSTVVVIASIVIAATAIALQGRLDRFREICGVAGTVISSLFLLAIALANLLILRSVWREFQKVRHGAALDEAGMESLLAGRGVLARLFRPLFRLISRSWQMYPLGFLFGLGFDTATEIGLLGIAATQAAAGMSPWQTLVFPALFTAGMALVDIADSVLMVGAYGWAFVNPLRKLWYNLTITAASVLVALLIGGIEALGLAGGRLHLNGWLWREAARLNEDLTNFGFAVIGIFAGCWIISMIIFRWKFSETASAKS